MKERWKRIKEVRGNYFISSWGRVVSLALGKMKVLKPEVMKKGYRRYRVGGKRIMAHLLVLEAFGCLKGEKTCCNHKDGNKTNNHVENLEWCTAKENTAHAWRTGLATSRKGVDHHKAKLNDKQVRVIKHLKSIGTSMTSKQIGDIFGVYETTIRKIFRGTAWKHIVI